MQWVPDTIDALTRMYKETGLGGLLMVTIVVAVFILVVTFSMILLRYTSQIVGLGREWVQAQRETVAAQKETSVNISERLDEQTRVLEQQTGVLHSQNEKIDTTNAKLESISHDSGQTANELQKLVGAFGSDPMRMCPLNDAAERLLAVAAEKGVKMTIEQARMMLARHNANKEARKEAAAAAEAEASSKREEQDQ